jgi:hypothetical protein
MKYETAWILDGSWRDICVLNTTLADWQKVFDWLRTSTYPIDFKINDVPSPLPDRLELFFNLRKEVSVLASVNVGGVLANCHFFSPSEIEFDIDPREVINEAREESIGRFMIELGKLLDREVILTLENWHEAAFLRYFRQKDKVVYNPITLEPGEPLRREEFLRLMAKAYGVDENDEHAIINKMLEAANRPAYRDD